MLNDSPAATAVACAPPGSGTSTGVSRSVCVPSPSSPELLSPHA